MFHHEGLRDADERRRRLMDSFLDDENSPFDRLRTGSGHEGFNSEERYHHAGGVEREDFWDAEWFVLDDENPPLS
jgi:hypothetical protein